jgi:hypothetical protein
VVVERVLRPGAMLRYKQERSTAVRCVVAGGRLGNAWRARERAAGKGNRAGAGGRTTCGGHSSRRWRSGDGRAAASGEALPAVGSRAEEHLRKEEEEREGVRGGLFGNLKNFRDLLVN